MVAFLIVFAADPEFIEFREDLDKCWMKKSLEMRLAELSVQATDPLVQINSINSNVKQLLSFRTAESTKFISDISGCVINVKEKLPELSSSSTVKVLRILMR
ncbi:hypothetical protein OESDEN_07145 [Oesophagostomum dentatum]|uniref:Uncharacterized protein n=1 Tax=Oesophagostomum dentatum TaxID=61180 RepID=A0A0B1T9W2_OESDE|nr:hypothetical protein OESDEN_07145 [Oesophagostomum dentatum]